MSRYRKKPVEIDAVHFDGTNWGEIHEFIGEGNPAAEFGANGHVLYINTLEGQMRCDPGDWLIRGVKGEYYPCKSDIFDATYEPVSDA